ncbi:MAG: nicotinamide riboside transporter PnuC, partial [Fusobacteriaceae bacterium]
VTYAEHIVTVIIGLCVFLAARNSIWNWPVGLVGVTGYGLSAYFLWGLYADAYLQIFYFFTGVVGWYYWSHGGKDKDSAPIVDSSIIEMVLTVTSIGMASYILGGYLKETTNSVVPYLDAFTTAICLLAQIFMMVRSRFNWILWFIANVAYVYMFYVKGLNLLAVEYAVFSLNAAYGYYVWSKKMKDQQVVANYLSGTK